MRLRDRPLPHAPRARHGTARIERPARFAAGDGGRERLDDSLPRPASLVHTAVSSDREFPAGAGPRETVLAHLAAGATDHLVGQYALRVPGIVGCGGSAGGRLRAL